MRNEAELNVPDVTTHSKDARRRTNGTGKLHGIGHAPQVVATESLWERFRSTFTSETLDVAGRTVTGFVVPHWAAGVLLAAIIGSMGFMYSRLSDQRDMLIRLDTQLQERANHESEYRGEFKTKLNVQQLQIDNATTELKVVKSMLTPQQLRYLEQNTRKADN